MTERTIVIQNGRGIAAAKRLGVGEKRERKWYATAEEVEAIKGEAARKAEEDKARERALWEANNRRHMAYEVANVAQDAVATWVANIWPGPYTPAGDDLASAVASVGVDSSGWYWKHNGGTSVFGITIDGVKHDLFAFCREGRKHLVTVGFSYGDYFPRRDPWYVRARFRRKARPGLADVERETVMPKRISEDF